MNTKTPKIVHHIWLTRGPGLPKAYEQFVNSAKKNMPYASFKMWNFQTLKELDDPNLEIVIEKCRNFSQMSDYIRFLALYKFGGVYLDTDIDVVEPVPEEFFDHEFLAFGGNPYINEYVCSAPLLSNKGNPVFKKCMESILSHIDELKADVKNELTGPTLFSSVLKSESHQPVILDGNFLHFGDQKANQKFQSFRHIYWKYDWNGNAKHFRNLLAQIFGPRFITRVQLAYRKMMNK